jgi:hypothetical protein
MISPALREQITAKQCSRLLFHQITTLPRVGQMRRVKPPDHMFAKRESFSIGQCASWPVGKVVY